MCLFTPDRTPKSDKIKDYTQSSLVALPAFLQHSGLPRGGPVHTKSGPPISIIYKENATQTCLQANLMKTLSQWNSLFLDRSRFESNW